MSIFGAFRVHYALNRNLGPGYITNNMSLTELAVKYIVEVIRQVGYFGVFILMALESALVPIPSEIIMPFSGFLVARREMDFWIVVVMGSIGNLAGSLLAYYLGLKLGRDFILRYGKYFLISREHLKMTEEFFAKYGYIAVFVGKLLPAVRTVISFPAGLAKMDLLQFTVYTLVGSVIWCVFLTYLGVVLGENWEVVKEHGTLIDLLVIVSGVLLVIIYYFKHRKICNQYSN